MSELDYDIVNNIVLKTFFNTTVNTAIHCKNKDELITLCNLFEKHNEKTISDKSYLTFIPYYKKGMCLSNKRGYSDIGFYEDKCYQIIEAHEFINVANIVDLINQGFCIFETNKDSFNYIIDIIFKYKLFGWSIEQGWPLYSKYIVILNNTIYLTSYLDNLTLNAYKIYKVN